MITSANFLYNRNEMIVTCSKPARYQAENEMADDTATPPHLPARRHGNSQEGRRSHIIDSLGQPRRLRHAVQAGWHRLTVALEQHAQTLGQGRLHCHLLPPLAGDLPGER
jgi:hypothetical protein